MALDATKSNQQLVKAGKVWQLHFTHFEKEQVHVGPYSHFARGRGFVKGCREDRVYDGALSTAE